MPQFVPSGILLDCRREIDQGTRVKRWIAALLISGALPAKPAHSHDDPPEDSVSVSRAWRSIGQSACNAGIKKDQSVDIPANTAVTISYTRLDTEASYIAICYRSGEGEEWTFWAASATEGGGNHGVITFGPYQTGFQVLTNAVAKHGQDDIVSMEKHTRSDTPYGYQFEYFRLSSSATSNTEIDLTLAPPPAR